MSRSRRDVGQTFASVSRHGHARDLDRRRNHRVAEFEVVADHFDAVVPVQQIAGDGGLFDRMRKLAVFDPLPERAAESSGR